MNLIYLDTNVFTLISEDIDIQKKFISWANNQNLKIIISVILLSELIQKESKFPLFNELINNKKLEVIFLGGYDLICGLEINNYPTPITLQELSINSVINKLLNGNSFDFFNLKHSTNFMNAKENQKYISNTEFKRILNKWKLFYPPDNKNSYSKRKQSELMKMIENNMVSDLKAKMNLKDIDSSKIKTRMIINKSLMKKYLFNYTKNFDPNDFADIMHIAYSPYIKYFITEKNNSDILNQIKKETNLLNSTIIIKISDFRKDFKK